MVRNYTRQATGFRIFAGEDIPANLADHEERQMAEKSHYWDISQSDSRAGVLFTVSNDEHHMSADDFESVCKRFLAYRDKQRLEAKLTTDSEPQFAVGQGVTCVDPRAYNSPCDLLLTVVDVRTIPPSKKDPFTRHVYTVVTADDNQIYQREREEYQDNLVALPTAPFDLTQCLETDGGRALTACDGLLKAVWILGTGIKGVSKTKYPEQLLLGRWSAPDKGITADPKWGFYEHATLGFTPAALLNWNPRLVGLTDPFLPKK